MYVGHLARLKLPAQGRGADGPAHRPFAFRVPATWRRHEVQTGRAAAGSTSRLY